MGDDIWAHNVVERDFEVIRTAYLFERLKKPHSQGVMLLKDFVVRSLKLQLFSTLACRDDLRQSQMLLQQILA